MSSTSWQWPKANPDEAAHQIRQLERENAALRCQAIGQEETIDRLQCTIKAAMHVEGQLQAENAALRESRERLVRTASEVLEAFVLHKKVETGHPCPENMCICIDLRAAINAARKEGQR
jgi:FtsZ-binding cell division protein ZapB